MKKAMLRIIITLLTVSVMVMGSTVVAEARHLMGFDYYGKHYYKVVRTSSVHYNSWVGMAAAIPQDYRFFLGKKEYSAHPVVITSAREQAFVQELIQSYGPALIGASQAPGISAVDAGWQWITGEEWAYTNWAASQPDDGTSGEVNLLMNLDGTWSDVTFAASGAMCFVVECEIAG